MDLEILLQLADRRALPKVGDTISPGALGQHAHRIDAEARPQVLAERNICRREADGAAALVALLDDTFDLPRPAQKLGRLACPAGAQRLADAGGRVDLALAHHRVEDGDAKAALSAELAQLLDVAAT